jgi:hypothetical protein
LAEEYARFFSIGAVVRELEPMHASGHFQELIYRQARPTSRAVAVRESDAHSDASKPNPKEPDLKAILLILRGQARVVAICRASPKFGELLLRFTDAFGFGSDQRDFTRRKTRKTPCTTAVSSTISRKISDSVLPSSLNRLLCRKNPNSEATAQA